MNAVVSYVVTAFVQRRLSHSRFIHKTAVHRAHDSTIYWLRPMAHDPSSPPENW